MEKTAKVSSRKLGSLILFFAGRATIFQRSGERISLKVKREKERDSEKGRKEGEVANRPKSQPIPSWVRGSLDFIFLAN